MLQILTIAAVLFVFTAVNIGQTRPRPTPPSAATTADIQFKSSAAYAEIALRQTEMEAELESLLVDYTDEFPKVKELRQGIGFLTNGAGRLAIVKPADAAKLTSALGKLIVRKAEIEVELWRLRQTYADNHPEVKRAGKKVEIFEKSIKDILG